MAPIHNNLFLIFRTFRNWGPRALMIFTMTRTLQLFLNMINFPPRSFFRSTYCVDTFLAFLAPYCMAYIFNANITSFVGVMLKSKAEYMAPIFINFNHYPLRIDANITRFLAVFSAFLAFKRPIRIIRQNLFLSN